MIRTLTSLAALALVAALSGGPAGAQTYPTKTVTIIVPLAAGTGMDTLARLYGDKLAQVLGRPVVVENRPGAALALGAAAIATAPPDGHTMGVLTSGPMAIGPVLYKKINYDPQKDFVPISLYVKSPLVLVVDPALPIKSVPELIQYAKASAKPLTYSTPGRRRLPASVDRVHGAAFRPQVHPCALQEHTAVGPGHRRRPRQFRLCRSRRLAAADPRRQAARARGVVVDAAADGSRGAAVCGSRQRAGLRSGVLAHPVRAGRDTEGRSSSGCTAR